MNLTTRNRERIGGVAIHKGKNGKDETPIVLWDAVPKCEPETCPIVERCPYSKNGHCTLRLNYQKHVVDMVLDRLFFYAQLLSLIHISEPTRLY